MKKITALLTAMASVAIFGSLAACTDDEPPAESTNTKVADVLAEYSSAEISVDTLVALGSDEIVSIDDSGLMLVKRTAEDGTVTYTFFDITTNAYLPEEVSYVIPATVTDGIMYGGIDNFTKGIYYSTEIHGSETFYKFYSREGKVDAGAGDMHGLELSAADGTMTYVGMDGKLQTGKSPFDRYLTIEDAADPELIKLDGYYAQATDINGVYNFFDESGIWVKNVNLLAVFSENDLVKDTVVWTVGDRIFYQCTEILPDDAEEYDLLTRGYAGNAVKAQLKTAYYDVSEGETATVDDFMYVVRSQVEQPNDSVAVLNVSRITDGKTSVAEIVQSFDEDGEVLTNLQTLVSGAASYKAYENYVVLSDGDKEYVCMDEAVVGTFLANTFTYRNNMAYAQASGKYFLYNLDGTSYGMVDIEGSRWLKNGNLIYKEDTTLYLLDTTTMESSVFLTDILSKIYTYIEGGYIVKESGEDGVMGTADDTYAVYWFDGTSITDLKKAEKVNYVNVGNDAYVVVKTVNAEDSVQHLLVSAVSAKKA